MKTHKLSESDIEYIKSLVEHDITEAARDVSFFEEMRLEPKEYINEMISLSTKLGMDFWETVRLNCSDFEIKRLQALYAAKPVKKKQGAKKKIKLK